MELTSNAHSLTILIYIDGSLHRPVIGLTAMQNPYIAVADDLSIYFGNQIRIFF